MSRIGNRKLQIPTGVEAHLEENKLVVKSSKGTLDLVIDPLVKVEISENEIKTTPKIVINAGFSHPVEMVTPEGITVKSISNTEIELSGIDKQKVNEFAAKVREIRSPEPYKGKGIRYKGEYVRHKEGKKAAK